MTSQARGELVITAVFEKFTERAIKAVNLWEFVKKLPKGMDSPLGEGGAKMSGGQRQRIGIARAFYKDPEILLLDEATSALDSQNELEVTNAVKNLKEQGMTVLIIAHRLTTLRDCDRIIELRDGKIAGEHSYEELMKKSLWQDRQGPVAS